MKILFVITIILLVGLGITYKTTEASLSHCYLDAQDGMREQLRNGTMPSIEISCNIGKTIFSKSIRCMETVENSGVNKLVIPIIYKYQPKLNKANIKALQNQACALYPQSIIE